MRFLVTGASGNLGSYVLRAIREDGGDVTAWSGSRTGRLFGATLQPVDLADPDRVASAFREAPPDAVIHAGALASVADCHRDPRRAEQVNRDGSALLADLAGRARARLLLVSTDLVFDGEKGWYREQDPAAPLSTYGRSKRAAEHAVLAAPRSAVVRASLLFGPALAGQPSFFDQQLAALRERRALRLFADEWRTPLALDTAARGLLALAKSDFVGLIHMGGPERLSRLEMGQRLAALLGLDASVILATTRNSTPAPEPRPRDTSLDSGLWRGLVPGQPWPGLDESVRALIG